MCLGSKTIWSEQLEKNNYWAICRSVARPVVEEAEVRSQFSPYEIFVDKVVKSKGHPLTDHPITGHPGPRGGVEL
jgi:hypothetical protein